MLILAFLCLIDFKFNCLIYLENYEISLYSSTNNFGLYFQILISSLRIHFPQIMELQSDLLLHSQHLILLLLLHYYQIEMLIALSQLFYRHFIFPYEKYLCRHFFFKSNFIHSLIEFNLLEYVNVDCFN